MIVLLVSASSYWSALHAAPFLARIMQGVTGVVLSRSQAMIDHGMSLQWPGNDYTCAVGNLDMQTDRQTQSHGICMTSLPHYTCLASIIWLFMLIRICSPTQSRESRVQHGSFDYGYHGRRWSRWFWDAGRVQTPLLHPPCYQWAYGQLMLTVYTAYVKLCFTITTWVCMQLFNPALWHRLYLLYTCIFVSITQYLRL